MLCKSTIVFCSYLFCEKAINQYFIHRPEYLCFMLTIHDILSRVVNVFALIYISGPTRIASARGTTQDSRVSI